MTDIFNEAIARQTAKGELFEFAEKMHSDGITYREFINPAIPENLRKFYLKVDSSHKVLRNLRARTI